MTGAGEVSGPVVRRISVIVPAHDAGITIDDQLEALTAQECPSPWEIVVVANRCSDDTVDRARGWAESAGNLRVITADEVAGASYARNAGAAVATGSTLLFCDADDVVRPGWIEGMCEALRSADLVGGRLELLEPVDPELLRLFPVHDRQQRNGLAVHHTIAYALTASMACSRTLFESIGGFDQRLGHGNDDVVISMRAQRAGYRVGFTSEATCGYRLRHDFGLLTAQRQSYARANVLFERVYYPAARKPLGFEMALLGVIALRWVTSLPTASRAKWLVHVRVQAARVASHRSQGSAGGEPAPGTPPGFLVHLGRLHPALRRMRSVRRATLLWAARQPLVTFTVPPHVPRIGGLGLEAPYTVARRRMGDPSTDPTMSWLSEHLSAGQRVVDVGSGHGEFSAAAAAIVGPHGSVIAIEPQPQLAEACAANIERHGDLGSAGVLRSFVGDTTRVDDARTFIDEHLCPRISRQQGDRGPTVRTETAPLDHFIPDGCDVLRIATVDDLVEIIDGADTTLSSVEVLLMRVDGKARRAIDRSSSWQQLAARGTVRPLCALNDEPLTSGTTLDWSDSSWPPQVEPEWFIWCRGS